MAHIGIVVTCVVLSLSLGSLTSSETPGDGGAHEKRVSYEGAQLLRVDAQSTEIKEEISKLEDLGDFWNGISDNASEVDVFVKPDNLKQVKIFLSEKNLAFDVLIENIQNAIDTENPLSNEGEVDVDGRAENPIRWNSYRSLDNIHDYMDYLEKTYPTKCTVVTIGSSVEGRSIKGLKIRGEGISGSTTSDPAFFIDGGIHAREWISVAATAYLMKELVENPGTHDETFPTLKSAWFYVFPVINPDGYVYTQTTDRLWRKNRRPGPQHGSRHNEHREKNKCFGVDLSRNFHYRWGGPGSSKEPCKETYRGPSSFSEPETKAYSDFVLSEKSDNGQYYNYAYLSFRSYGQKILFPWSYDRVVHEDFYKFQSKGVAMAKSIVELTNVSYAVGPAAATLFLEPGAPGDWMADVPGFEYSYTIALRDTGFFGHLLPAHHIIPSGQEAMQILLSLLPTGGTNVPGR